MVDQKTIQTKGSENKAIIWKVAARFLFTAFLMLGVLFLAAGRVDWWEGWVYAAATLVELIVSRSVLLLKYPDTVTERMEAAQRENVKPWDRFLVPLIAVFAPLVSWIVVGLDARLRWSPDLPNGVQIAALVMIFAGSTFFSWATFTNRFISSHVRIQTDRGHTVIRKGPYRYMRHPGYAGGILSWFAVPVFFSSYWVAIPTALVITAYVIRTALEDRTLLKELPGYKEYAREVRYRLVPGVW